MRVRQMLPESRRDRRERYEVSSDDGAVLGWLEAWSSSRGRKFYRATVVDPADGERISLESSTNFNEAADRVVRFSVAPEDFAQHRRRGYSGHVDDEDRVVHGGDRKLPKR